MAVIELGRIGRDVELRYTPSGDAVCNIALAVDYGRKGQDGKRPTQWYEVSLWGKRAEALQPYLTKGSMIQVTAEDLHIETFTKGNGEASSKLVCRAMDVKLCGKPEGQQQPRQQSAPPKQQPAPAPQLSSQPMSDYDSFDDDIEF